MSERIKQLAEQARQYAWVNETHWSAGPERERLFEQKFAELIVQECIDVVERRYKYSNGTPVSFWQMSQDVQDLLKEHFGVEE